MKYFGFMPNDFINGEGVSVSVWMAGCPHHCQGCHNQHMWDYESGHEVSLVNTIEKIKKAIKANGITRNLSILGGEPLAPYNLEYTARIISSIRKAYPNIKIYLWTGYEYEYLIDHLNEDLRYILNNIDIMVDGQYDCHKRDITLPLRGSKNQRVLEMKYKSC